MTLHSPLERQHRDLGARLVEFGGYLMPLQYRSIREEHLAVRQQAGLFDVSHMGEVGVAGPGAEAFLQGLVTNDVARLRPGDALYTVMCTDGGGIVDDLLVYRQAPSEFCCVINAARHDADLAWMRDHLTGSDVTLTDLSATTALLAIQGPRAAGILAPLCPDVDLAAVRPYHFTTGMVAGVAATISRTGYTGEDGFELYLPTEAAPRVWALLLEVGGPQGLQPAGLGARDTLRLEAGLRLYGQDIDEGTDPLTAGLGWTVKLGKGPFVGAPALRAHAQAGTERAFVGLRLGPGAIARHGQPIEWDGAGVGTVTSGTYSFTLGTGIAMGYVERGRATLGTELAVSVRGKAATATVVALPFYRRPAP
ncbi:MAG TPA: glycine cleavage system aminomethyltransferase GcvT [Candidatus Dormibacteraeota bacterium]|nr:glycine cleavage system aminomethyltransferase GcvT [Candidatus Dormibacteraeota bacterium]